MSNTNNPLSGHFRTPKLYTSLPTGGKFYDDTIVDMPSTNELPVYPMTAKRNRDNRRKYQRHE